MVKSFENVITITLSKREKGILHLGHLGIESTKFNTRRTVHWPNINDDIENLNVYIKQSVKFIEIISGTT